MDCAFCPQQKLIIFCSSNPTYHNLPLFFFFFSSSATISTMKLSAALLLVALKVSTASNPDDDLPTCPDGLVTKQQCYDYCSSMPDSVSRGWYAQHKGGAGNISQCTCTVGPNSADPSDYSCSRTPTSPPPMPPMRRNEKCAKSGIDDVQSCQDFCNGEYRRFPKAIVDANGFLKCECLDEQGGNVEWFCTASGRRPTQQEESYLRSG